MPSSTLRTRSFTYARARLGTALKASAMSKSLGDVPPDEGARPLVPPGPHRVYVVDDRWTNVRQIVETIAIVAAGLWAFYTFVYQERIKPAGEPAAIVTSISIHRLGRDSRRDILQVSTVLRNVGKTEIDIAADGFNVFGIRYETQPRNKANDDGKLAEIDRDIPIRSQTLVRSFMELRGAAVDGDANRHIIMQPDSTETLAKTVVVPRGAYDSLLAFDIAWPVKTPVRKKIDVKIVHQRNGSLWLHGPDDLAEDDNFTEFALIP
jgi:hypothetical protein